MGEHMQLIGDKIIENRHEISNLSMKYRMEEDPELVKKIQSRQLSSLTQEEAEEFSSKLIIYLGQAVYGDQQLYFNLVTEWSKKAGEIAVSEGIPLEESLDGLRFFRKAILQILKEEANGSIITIDDVIDTCSIIDPLVDRCIYCYSLAYIDDHRREMRKAYSDIQELLMPIVPVTNGVAVFPIIGELNEDRSQYILEKTLEESKRLQLQHLIIELSGIVTIDTMVAHNLNSIFNALKLLGVEPVLTGLSAEVTRSVISFGIDFKDISIYRNLQGALESIGFVQKPKK